MRLKNFFLQSVIALILSSTVITGQAETGDSDDDQDLDFNGSDCIWIRSIRDYTPLDDRTLLIWGGASRPYYVRLLQPARDMRSSFGMSVDSRDDRLCPFGGDALKFGDFDRFPAKVRSISRISKDQADAILVRFGKKQGDEPQTPPPQDVQGAEVEELD